MQDDWTKLWNGSIDAFSRVNQFFNVCDVTFVPQLKFWDKFPAPPIPRCLLRLIQEKKTRKFSYSARHKYSLMKWWPTLNAILKICSVRPLPNTASFTTSTKSTVPWEVAGSSWEAPTRHKSDKLVLFCLRVYFPSASSCPLCDAASLETSWRWWASFAAPPPTTILLKTAALPQRQNTPRHPQTPGKIIEEKKCSHF